MFALAEQPETRLQGIARRRRELDAMEAEWLALVDDYDRSGDWWDDGFGSAAAAMRAECRMTPTAARTHVRLARRLAHLPNVAEAFAAGEISREHVAVIARACTPERLGAFDELEPAFLAAAQGSDPDGLRGVVRYACDALDGDGGARSDEDVFKSRRFFVSPTFDGVGMIDGLLDPIGTETLITALDAEMERDRRANDERTPTQRRADALVRLCRLALDRGEVGGSRNVKPHLTLVGDLETLAGSSPELVRDVRAEAAHVGRLSQATLERIACDCTLSRVITAGRSEVLDVGRATRTVSAALWKALVVRDGHCRAPGCDRPPGWCEAHHVKHWAHGGETSLDNLELLCWEHHRQRHNDAWRRRPDRQ